MYRQHPDDPEVIARPAVNADLGPLFDHSAPAGDPRLQIRAKISAGKAARLEVMLTAYRRRGPSTSDEISALLGWTPFYGRPRTSELLDAELLRDTGLRRPSVNGHPMAVCEAVA